MDSVSRLAEVVRKKIGKKDFVVASHSEPFIHYYEESEVKWRRAGGGLVTALDPLMQRCGGTWVAYAAGNADREGLDGMNVLRAPPVNPAYSLKRVFLDKEVAAEYLDGVAHASLWPWCHFTYVRPAFQEERWPAYRAANMAFANAVLEAIGGRPAFVWIQDYHLALAAKYIKEKRPDVVTAHFWHIPWPNGEIFKVCPWGPEILEAMLHNDLIGFQIRYYANNFLDSIDQTLQARVDREVSTIYYKESQTKVMDFPISIDCSQVRELSSSITPAKMEAKRKQLGLVADKIALGVDRLDYSKGLLEKLMALDLFFRQNPDWAGRLTLVQVASPTRQQVPAYKDNVDRVTSLVSEINDRWSSGKWKPIIFLDKFMDYGSIIALYRMADACLVTSLHDGMNLVSKEFVAANPPGKGILVLSKFTGTSRELKGAIIINPYSIQETASAIRQALEMPEEEKKARMAKMAQEVAENDVYDWATHFIEHIAKLESTVL